MSITAGTVVWLLMGSLILSGLAVVLDRVNFPQKPFRGQRILPGEEGASRDRTGAHIIERAGDDNNEEPEVGR